MNNEKQSEQVEAPPEISTLLPVDDKTLWRDAGRFIPSYNEERDEYAHRRSILRDNVIVADAYGERAAKIICDSVNVRADRGDERVREIRERQSSRRETLYGADIDYLLALLDRGVGGQSDVIAFTALRGVLERLRSKNLNPERDWYLGWNSAIDCLINDIDARARSAAPSPPSTEQPMLTEHAEDAELLEVALAILERLDVLEAIWDKNARREAAQQEVAAIVGNFLRARLKGGGSNG